jgi:hypothetical protein
MDEIRRILQSFNDTKDCALAYATLAQMALQTARQQVIELRRRVAMLEPVREAIPISVQVSSVQDSLEDLHKMRTQVNQRRGRAVIDDKEAGV